MRTVLVGGLAMLALSGLAAASASAALPEFKPVPVKKKFTSSSGKSLWRASSASDDMECTKSTTTGEITGASTIGKAVIKFTGCDFYQGAKGPCAVHSANTANSGEIVSDALKGELGTVKTTEAPVGFLASRLSS